MIFLTVLSHLKGLKKIYALIDLLSKLDGLSEPIRECGKDLLALIGVIDLLNVRWNGNYEEPSITNE